MEARVRLAPSAIHRATGMTSNDPAAADLERSSQQWLPRLARGSARRDERPAAAGRERASQQWVALLARETARRQGRAGSALDALWDVLEEWFAADEFAGSALAAAVAAPPDGRGPAA